MEKSELIVVLVHGTLSLVCARPRSCFLYSTLLPYPTIITLPCTSKTTLTDLECTRCLQTSS